MKPGKKLFKKNLSSRGQYLFRISSKSLFSLVLFLGIIPCQVQAATGCLRPNGTMYTVTEVGDGFHYLATPNIANVEGSYCVTASSTPCYVRRGSPIAGYFNDGFVANYVSPTLCPLDDKIWILLVIAGCLGFFSLRVRPHLIKS